MKLRRIFVNQIVIHNHEFLKIINLTMRFTIVAIFFVAKILCIDNGVGLVPPMGINTRNYYHCNVSQELILNTINTIIKLGLIEVGYIYLNIDDCWMSNEREEGELTPNKSRFSYGMKSLIKMCHEKEIKIGLTAGSGTKTCNGFPGSEGFERMDAMTFRDWKIDYLIYDNCDKDFLNNKTKYSKMRDSLNATGRSIYYSISDGGSNEIWIWGKNVSNSWRTTSDISDRFETIREIYIKNILLREYAGPGGWNDLDMLMVGSKNMTLKEHRTHFALWAMIKSPLLIGVNIENITKVHLDILKNKDIIELNQDKLGKPARCMIWCDNEDFSGNANHPQFGVMELTDGNYAVSVTNWNSEKLRVKSEVTLKKLEIKEGKYRVIDLWTKKDMGIITEAFIVNALSSHDTAVFKLIKIISHN